MTIERPDEIQIENARLIYRNFKGEGSRYNAEGNRNFSVRLTMEKAAALRNKGWNVKFPKQPEDGKFEREPFLTVAVKFGRIEELWPQVYVKSSRVAAPVKYTEDMLKELDSADLEKVDLIIRPRMWTDDATGETHVKAYLNKMYVTLAQDKFYDEFFGTESLSSDMPWD